MKKQLPKFLICHNEMADKNIYIMHTQTPRFIAKVEDNDINVIEQIDYIMPNALELASIMRRMGDWYYSYLQFKKAKQ